MKRTTLSFLTMMILVGLIATLADASSGDSLEQTQSRVAQSGLTSKSFSLKHRDSEEIVGEVQRHLSNRGQITWGPRGSFTIKDRPDVIRRVESLIRKFDVPYKRFEIKLQFLEAYSHLPPPPRPPDILGLDDLHNVLEDLHHKVMRVFKFEGYKDVATITIRGKEGERMSARVAGGRYRVEFRPQYLDQGGKKVVALRNFSLKNRSGKQLLGATVNVGLGKEVILGKSQGEEGADALITVVKADIQRR